MSNLPIIKYRAQDNNGTVLPLATMTFYVAGQATLLADTWSDPGMTVVNENPVEADGDGYFPEVFLDPTQGYYVELRDPDGVLIWDADDVYGTSLGASTITTRVRQSGTSPVDFGAIGDGAADESEEVQDAIDAATFVVDLQGLIYRCDNFLTLPSDVQIINGTLDFTSCNDDEYVRIVGTIGNAIALGGDIAAGDTETLISPVGLSVGDVLFISSSAAWRDGTGKTGELSVYSEVSEGVILGKPARDAYTAVSSSAKKITPKTGVSFRSVTFVGSSSASGDGVLVFADLSRRLRFDDCVFSGIKGAGIRLNTCLDVAINGCAFSDGASSSVGVEIAECCEQITIESCDFERLGEGVNIGTAGTRDGVCRDVMVDGCRIVAPVVNGIAVNQLTQNATLVDNEVEAVDVPAIALASASEVKLLGNKARTTGDRCIHATGIVDAVLMTGNMFERVDTTGPVCEFAGTGAGNISGVNAVGNRLKGGTYGITGSNVASGTFARNSNVFTGQATGEINGLGTNLAIEVGAITAGAITSTDIVTASAADKIPRAGGDGKLAAAWIPDVSGTYAPAANGVTNGDSHDHSGGDGGQIAHTALSAIGTNSHSTIDSHIGSTSNPHSVTAAQAGAIATETAGAASGVATLDGSSKVVQEPASKAQASGIASLNSSSTVVQNQANFCAGRIADDGTTIWARGVSFTSARTGTGVYTITASGVTTSSSIVVTLNATGCTFEAHPGTGVFTVGTAYSGSPANSEFCFMAFW